MKQETKKLFPINEQDPLLSNISVDKWWEVKRDKRRKEQLKKQVIRKHSPIEEPDEKKQ